MTGSPHVVLAVLAVGNLIAIGVDVISVSHLTKVRHRNARAPITPELTGESLAHADPFLARFTAEDERAVGLSDVAVARIWTGKEAVAKTLGTGFWQKGIAWSDIRVSTGAVVRFAGAAVEVAGSDRYVLKHVRDGDLMIAMAWRYAVTLL